MPYKNREDQLECQRRRYRANMEFLRSFKSKPCTDCGIQYPHYMMEFDHIEPRQGRTIGQYTNNRKRLLEEVAKCEVVCANCHSARTWFRSQK